MRSHSVLANIDVFCRKISENFDLFLYFQASWKNLYVFCKIISLLATYLILISFLAGAEQLICKAPPLAASGRLTLFEKAFLKQHNFISKFTNYIWFLIDQEFMLNSKSIWCKLGRE